MKICLHDEGHMTEMAAIPMYGKKTLQTSPESAGRFPGNLVCTPVHHNLVK